MVAFTLLVGTEIHRIIMDSNLITSRELEEPHIL